MKGLNTPRFSLRNTLSTYIASLTADNYLCTLYLATANYNFPGFCIYFSYGIWHSTQAGSHDNLSLHTLEPASSSVKDELLDDSDMEVNSNNKN